MARKGYWIAHVRVSNPEGYKEYIAANAAAFAKYGARFVVRAGKFEQREGSLGERHVVIEFPSYEQAVACFESPEYQRALAIRKNHSTADMVIVEGVD